jgi:hypothetical protein
MIFAPAKSCIIRPDVTIGDMPSSIKVPDNKKSHNISQNISKIVTQKYKRFTADELEFSSANGSAILMLKFFFAFAPASFREVYSISIAFHCSY